jgi:hypothetical protein
MVITGRQILWANQAKFLDEAADSLVKKLFSRF